MSKLTKTEALRQIAEEAVPDNLDLWPQVRARVRPIHVGRPARRQRFAAAMVSVLAANARKRLIDGT